MAKKPLLLVVDDEIEITRMLKETLEDEGFAVQTLSDGGKVIQQVGALVPDLVLLDIFMPNNNGLELLVQIKAHYPTQKVIMISGYGTISIALEAIKKGAIDFIEKPLNLDDLLSKLAFLKNDYAQEYVAAGHMDENKCPLVGSSTLFCEFLRHVQMVVPCQGPVTIYGPTGCGKTLIAQYIHTLRHGKENQNFVVIDCATQQLTDLKFLEQPGTLFLKNIDQLESYGQKNLLAFIESNKNYPLLVSSTPNLYKRIIKDLFNKILFCRLNALSVELPSINKRRYDIPLLVDAFLKEANMDFGKHCSLAVEALRLLRNYEWIGDVAQIKTVIRRAVESCKHKDQDIDVYFLKALLPECTQFFLSEQLYLRFNSLEQATSAFQHHYLKHLLQSHQYDFVQVANFLQIPVAQLHDKMIKLQINM